jgi:DNA-binding MarR family transcriptional regulator
VVLTELRNISGQVDQAVSDSLGLNRTDARCLSCLIIRGSMTSGDLATAAGIAPTALTFAVDRLVQAGYASRVRDPADRRRVLVEATELARRFAEQTWAAAVAQTQEQLSTYTAAELLLITGFLRDHIDVQRRHIERIREQRDGGER